MRLVDAYDVIVTLNHLQKDCMGYIGGVDMKRVIDKVPTVEADVVRCKDCKYWFYFIESEKHHCTEWDKPLWDCPIREEDDFCSRGVKR